MSKGHQHWLVLFDRLPKDIKDGEGGLAHLNTFKFFLTSFGFLTSMCFCWPSYLSVLALGHETELGLHARAPPSLSPAQRTSYGKETFKAGGNFVFKNCFQLTLES